MFAWRRFGLVTFLFTNVHLFVFKMKFSEQDGTPNVKDGNLLFVPKLKRFSFLCFVSVMELAQRGAKLGNSHQIDAFAVVLFRPKT